jgi:hypothetical protein
MINNHPGDQSIFDLSRSYTEIGRSWWKSSQLHSRLEVEVSAPSFVYRLSDDTLKHCFGFVGD